MLCISLEKLGHDAGQVHNQCMLVARVVIYEKSFLALGHCLFVYSIKDFYDRGRSWFQDVALFVYIVRK